MIQDFQGEIGGFFKLSEGLAIKQVQKQVETDGKALKMLLEANSASIPPAVGAKS